MRTRHTLAAATAVALLALTGCSADPDAPASRPTASTTAPLTDKQAQECTDEVYAHITANNALGLDEQRPTACEGMSDDEYADTLLAVTERVNETAREDLQDQIDEAAEDQ